MKVRSLHFDMKGLIPKLEIINSILTTNHTKMLGAD
jgi:hypothetical protein